MEKGTNIISEQLDEFSQCAFSQLHLCSLHPYQETECCQHGEVLLVLPSGHTHTHPFPKDSH